MSEETTLEEREEEVVEEGTDTKPVAPGSKIKAKPVRGDVQVDFTNPERETLKPRLSKNQKVFTNGFKIPGFSGYTDVPGKVCVDCGWRGMKFSTKCAKCGGELAPEESS
ncbi:MAG TPA: hypothetical protein VHJ78_09815 [Actinomycetota bacterium]|nr:hypothetical protein [Actinomycetota bacterium]